MFDAERALDYPRSMLSMLVAALSLWSGDVSGTALENIELRATDSMNRYQLLLGETIAWNVFCSAAPGQVSCTYDPQTSTVTPMKLVLTGAKGFVVAAEERLLLQRTAENWEVRTSSTGELVAEIFTEPQLEAALEPKLSPRERRSIAAVALILLAFEDNEELRAPSADAPREPRSKLGFSPVLGIAMQLISPLPNSGAFSRNNAGFFTFRLGVGFLERLELTLDFSVGGRGLDAAVLADRIGESGTIDTLSNTTCCDNTTVGGDASATLTMLSLRYAFSNDSLRPYLGVAAGMRYEPVIFRSPDLLRVCAGSGEENCHAATGWSIEGPNVAYLAGAVAGVTYTLFGSTFTGFELFAEAQAHATFWAEPELAFDGDVVPESLRAYERWDALDYGGPVLDIAVLAGVALRLSL